jgi:hypothetical protein
MKEDIMFQQMLNASRAILLRPSVATFEEYERDDLGWALIYTLIAAVAAAILRAVGGLLQRAALEQQMANLEQQLGNSPMLPFIRSMIGGGGLVFTLIFTLFATVIGFFLGVGIIYLLGRAFGGTGTFGEMAYDIALYSAPIAVLGALLGIIPIVGSLAALALGIYEIYLYWLSVQAGMNLPGSKALWVILIPILVVVLLCCGIFVLAFFVIAGASRS